MSGLRQRPANTLPSVTPVQLLADGFADEQASLAWSHKGVDLIG